MVNASTRRNLSDELELDRLGLLSLRVYLEINEATRS
jgi:hypothetical protein